jgi:competence protein ComEC
MKIDKKWLFSKVHSYYFVISFFGGLICGIVFSLVTDEVVFKSGFWLLLSVAFLLVSLVKFRRGFLVLMFISGLLLGVWRSSNYEFARQDFRQYFGKNLVVSGKIIDDISHGPSGETRFKINKIIIDGKNLNGEIWASTRDGVELKRSDRVEINGRLNNGFGSFFASMSGADVISVAKESATDYGLVMRDGFASATNDAIPEPERSLGLGFLLGQKNDLPEDLQNQIKLLGLSHIVVASGYNLTILVAFARKIFARISKYLSAITAGGMIAGFILITGFSPSMSRAGLVAGFSLLAWYYGRKIHPVVLLLVSAGITLMIKPSYIWGDLGWYLSFLAFIGVLVLAPLLHHFFWGVTKKPSWVRELLVVTFSAQLMTLPILLYSFGTFSLYSLVANALVLPAIPFAMAGVFVSGLAGLVVPAVAGILSIPAVWLLKYCTFVIDRVSAFPGVLSELSINFWQLFFSYGVLLFLIIMLKLKTKHNFLKDKMIID